MVHSAAFLALLAFSAWGQSYVELKATLGLTEVQVDRLQSLKATAHPAPPKPQTPATIYAYRRGDFLNAWQQEEGAALNLALAVLTDTQRDRLSTAASVLEMQSGAMQLVSIGAITCGQWPGTCACFYPIRQDQTKLGLSEAQMARFEQLRVVYRWPKQSEDLIASHALVLDVLNEEQQTKLAAFEADLRLVNEAMDIGLLARPGKGEPLCN